MRDVILNIEVPPNSLANADRNFFHATSEVQNRSTQSSRFFMSYSNIRIPERNCLFSRFLKVAKQYDRRLQFLKTESEADNEPFNSDSMEGFRQFTWQLLPTKKGSLVLKDNGNLRAVWNCDGESFIGLQFMNSDSIEYVLFSDDGARSSIVSRSYGVANSSAVISQLKALNLNWMMYEQPEDSI